MEWWSIVLGLAASAGFIATNYILNRKAMLAVQFAAIVFVSTQYALLSVWSVVAVNLLLVLRNLILLKFSLQGRGLVSLSAGFAVALMGLSATLGLLVNPLDYLALVAGLFNLAAFATHQIIGTKLGLGLSSLSWTIFNILQGNWQNAIGDIFGTAAATVALIRIRRLRQIPNPAKL